MADEDPVIITSDLSRTVEEDGITVEVNIFRLETDEHWCLEVVNEAGTSTVWEDTFATDELAFEVFTRTVETEGMSAFSEEAVPPTLH
ncbi:MAG: hypothetical protein EOP13_16265 [Pseudomonas sp.]|uniref:hypothetical protein n=1 Tax=Pseudomonas sp. TaxID=306 RepID=UPI0012213346|nr:hypothetical protein [Pseudomonas sp.]RZI72059.1 MAG: hypothetical protein EOP13_16265 [Pseudomonas sp.]